MDSGLSCFRASVLNTRSGQIERDAPCPLCHLAAQHPPGKKRLRAHNIIHANPLISSFSMSMLRGEMDTLEKACIHLLSSRASDSSWTLMIKEKKKPLTCLCLQDISWRQKPKAPPIFFFHHCKLQNSEKTRLLCLKGCFGKKRKEHESYLEPSVAIQARTSLLPLEHGTHGKAHVCISLYPEACSPQTGA